MANKLVVILIGVCIMVTSVAAATKTLHPARNDALKRLDAIFNNTRMRESFIRCFMGRGLCFKEAMELKNMLPEALVNNCSKCSEVQKLSINRFFDYLMDKRPLLFNRLVTKFDPKGEFKKHAEQKVNEENSDVKATATILQDTITQQANSTQEDTTISD